VFTREDGGALPPEVLTCTFIALVGRTGLPPVRLHDLRHGAATLMLAGMELKTIADQLGHSSVVLTADTLPPETARTAAELTAALLFPARIPARKPAIRQARGRPLPTRGRHHRNQRYAA